MRNIIFVAAIVFYSLLMGGQEDPFIKTIEKVKLSIVPVACSTIPDVNQQVAINQIEGTGFFINYDGDFITAAHVISEHFKWNRKGEPDLTCFPVIYVPNPSWKSSRWFQFGSCIVDDSIDIAVCKTRVNPFGEVGLHLARLHLSARIPEDGTAVAFTGFPQLIVVPVTSRANIATAGDFLFNGKIETDILIDKTTWHGVSGGPLYLADGTVVGMIVKMGDGLWSGMGFARQTSIFMKFLSDKKITIWQEEEKKQQEKQMPKPKP